MNKNDIRIVIGTRTIATGWWALMIEVLVALALFCLGVVFGLRLT